MVHTDSAPSIIATEHFNFNIDGHHQETTYIKANLLKEPLTLFPPPNINSNKIIKPPKDINMLTIDRENVELVRFIEDNFNYFKKQTGAINNDTDHLLQQQQQQKIAGLHTGALSDSNFLSYTNNRDPILSSSQDDDDDDNKTSGNKLDKHHKRRTTCSDSDFIISNGYTSNIILPLKSKISFNGNGNHGGGCSNKIKNTNNNNSSNNKSQRLKNQLSFTAKSRTANFFKIQKPSVLSKSYNDSFSKKKDNSEITTLQRVFSDGNYTNIKNNDNSIPSSPDFNTVDMFIKLLECKSSEKNLRDTKHVNNLNYDVTFNYNEIVTKCDPIILNVATNCLHVKSICESQTLISQNITKRSNEQLLLIDNQQQQQQQHIPEQSSNDNILLLINDTAESISSLSTINNKCLQDDLVSNNNNNNNISIISPSIIDNDNNSESLVNIDLIAPQQSSSSSLDAVAAIRNVPETNNLIFLTDGTDNNALDINNIPTLLPTITSIVMSSTNSIENVVSDNKLPLTLIDENNIIDIISSDDKCVEKNLVSNVSDSISDINIKNDIPSTIKSHNLNVNNAIAKKSGRGRQSSVVTYDINVINNSEEMSPENVGASAGYSSSMGKQQCAAITNRRSTSSTSKRIFFFLRKIFVFTYI